MKKILLIILPLVALVAIATAFNRGKADEQAAQKIRKVKTVQPKAVNYREDIFASGQLAAREEMKLSFKTGGIIEKIHVREGQYVKKGQLLATLDLDEIRAQSQQAKLGEQQANITIDNAQLALKIAERDYRNAKALYQDSVATLEQLENAELQLNNARNQLEAAQTNLDYSQQNSNIVDFNLTHSRILAPNNGIILKKTAEVNELVGPGLPVFLFGSKDKAQVIRVNLIDKDIIHVNLGDEASVQFDAYPGKKFPGTVQEIASMADPYTGTYEVEVEVQDQGEKLLSGFIGQVMIHTKNSQSLWSIPVDALVSGNQQQGVIFTVKDQKAIKNQVSIFKLEQDQLLIRSGLNNQDAVVVQGAGYLEDQERVETY